MPDHLDRRPVVRLGVLTGGGDCPGLNAALRALVRAAIKENDATIIGFRDAWRGVLEDDSVELTINGLRGILPQGGTILGTSRGGPWDVEGGPERVAEVAELHGLDGIVVIGGNGSLTVAQRVNDEICVPTVGVPKTIDNDVLGTDLTFGFQTAVQIASDAIDRLHTTAEAHDRCMLVEVMGRDAGWIAAHAGLAGGATAVLVPEVPFRLDNVAGLIEARHQRGLYASIVVVAEGAREMGLAHDPVQRSGGSLAASLAPRLENVTGVDTRVVVLGHLQRGGTPVAADRVLASRFGIRAARLAAAGRWGRFAALKGTEIADEALTVPSGGTKHLDLALYADVELFAG